ncbi:MAG: hypothetical protein CUN55_08230 [Phototrophicales bacterium]|nr:MAG: hypothetical protein CUN55_08230 [Phototrophicales bacterium]
MFVLQHEVMEEGIMSTVVWYEENRVLFVQHEGVLTHEKVTHWNAIAADLMDAVPPSVRKVHIILDATKVTAVDLNLKTVLADPVVQRLVQHPKYGWGIYVGNKRNPLYMFFASVIGQKFNEDIKFFDTELEAVEFLRTQDLDLEHLQVKHYVY